MGGPGAEITATGQSDEGVCARTPAVAEEIVRQAGVANCAAVTDEHLAGVMWLNLGGQGIRELRSGDFAGLTGIGGLSLDNNELAKLPRDIFAGLTELDFVGLPRNQLTELPPDIFRWLAEVEAR